MSDSGKGKVSGKMSDSVEGKYDDYVPELIDNTKVLQAELKEMAIGDPYLLAHSNKNAALPPATAVTKPDSQPSESAAENVKPEKRKFEEKGKGKEVEEKHEDGGGGEEVKEEAAVLEPRRKKPKGRTQKTRSVKGLLEGTEKIDIHPDDQDYY